MISQEERIIEKLQKKTNINSKEARKILESCGWNLLDAVVKIECENKGEEFTEKTFYTNKSWETYNKPSALIDLSKEDINYKFDKKESGFKLFEWICELIDICNNILVKVSRKGKKKFEVPVTVFIVLTILLVGSMIPIMIIALIFDVEFSVSSKKTNVTKIDEMLKDLAGFVKGIKERIKKEL
ncbi:DUF4342 domain-containing protein [uncultured Clostridium sp.]|uniref:DUF4342 domain-containing protein n=1 Tax=uncultured Clostridium sp. TaxID=59620 RepID=UPI002611D1E7|nr:DUF4342 domain-containing protein [uncultured Clostridium sp.]